MLHIDNKIPAKYKDFIYKFKRKDLDNMREEKLANIAYHMENL